MNTRARPVGRGLYGGSVFVSQILRRHMRHELAIGLLLSNYLLALIAYRLPGIIEGPLPLLAQPKKKTTLSHRPLNLYPYCILIGAVNIDFGARALLPLFFRTTW